MGLSDYQYISIYISNRIIFGKSIYIYIYQWDYVRSRAKNFIFAGYLRNLWDLEKGWSSPTLHVFFARMGDL